MKKIAIIFSLILHSLFMRVYADDCAYEFSTLQFCNGTTMIVLKDDCTMELWSNDILLSDGTWERETQNSIKNILLSYGNETKQAELVYSVSIDYSGNVQVEYKNLVIDYNEYAICN